MKKFTVSEDTEVVLNGKKYLLESGDEISYEPEDEDTNLKSVNKLVKKALDSGRIPTIEDFRSDDFNNAHTVVDLIYVFAYNFKRKGGKPPKWMYDMVAKEESIFGENINDALRDVWPKGPPPTKEEEMMAMSKKADYRRAQRVRREREREQLDNI